MVSPLFVRMTPEKYGKFLVNFATVDLTLLGTRIYSEQIPQCDLICGISLDLFLGALLFIHGTNRLINERGMSKNQTSFEKGKFYSNLYTCNVTP